ncbi:MAG: DUF4293 domain-containing protein [Chryseolinea sp.]
MWQRIQTVFLVIVIIGVLVTLIFPIWTINSNGEQTVLTGFYLLKGNVYQYTPYAITAMLAIASATLALIQITKYKSRVTQMKMGALNSFFLVGVCGSAYWFSSQLIKLMGPGQYGLGMWLPAIAILANLLANRFIRKDEKLVRDSNRLR